MCDCAYMGLQLNPYDICLANKKINGKQCTFPGMWMIIRSHKCNRTLLITS